jgi:hypothetical protein
MVRAISVLLIDGHEQDRQFYAQQLSLRSADYVIFESRTGQTGRYQSHETHCVIVELELGHERI